VTTTVTKMTLMTQAAHSTNCQPTAPVVHGFTGGPSGLWQRHPHH